MATSGSVHPIERPRGPAPACVATYREDIRWSTNLQRTAEWRATATDAIVIEAVVRDRSAILAFLIEEPDAAKVEAVLDRAISGAADLAEFAATRAENDLDLAEMAKALAVFRDFRPMARDQALLAGAL